MAEDYIPPVGFAREPAHERRRWIGRIFLLLFVILIGWLLVNRVFNPPQDPQINPIESELPAPI